MWRVGIKAERLGESGRDRSGVGAEGVTRIYHLFFHRALTFVIVVHRQPFTFRRQRRGKNEHEWTMVNSVQCIIIGARRPDAELRGPSPLCR